MEHLEKRDSRDLKDLLDLWDLLDLEDRLVEREQMVQSSIIAVTISLLIV